MSAGDAGLAAYAVLITAFVVFLMYLLHESQKDVRRLAKRLHPSSRRPTLSILERPRVPQPRGGGW